MTIKHKSAAVLNEVKGAPTKETLYIPEEEAAGLEVGATDAKGRLIESIEQVAPMTDDEAHLEERFANSVSNNALGDNMAGRAAFRAEDTLQAIATTPARIALNVAEIAEPVVHWFDDDDKPLVDRGEFDRKYKPVTFLSAAGASVADYITAGKLTAPIKGASLATKVGREVVRNLLSVNSQDDTASAMLKDTWIAETPFLGAAIDTLATKDEDTPMVRRFKNTIEQVGLDKLVEAIPKVARRGTAGNKAIDAVLPNLPNDNSVPVATVNDVFKKAGIDDAAADNYTRMMSSYAAVVKGANETVDSSVESLKLAIEKTSKSNKLATAKGAYSRSGGIQLTEAADNTTLVHEMFGHYILEDILRRETAGSLSQEGKDILSGIRSYIGETGAKGWTVRQHEKFANAVVNWFSTSDKAPKGSEEAFKSIQQLVRNITDDMITTSAKGTPANAFGNTLARLFETSGMTTRRAGLAADGILTTKPITAGGQSFSFIEPSAINPDNINQSKQLSDLYHELYSNTHAQREALRKQPGYAEKVHELKERIATGLNITTAKIDNSIKRNTDIEDAIVAYGQIENACAARLNELACLAGEADTESSKLILYARHKRISDILDNSRANIAHRIMDDTITDDMLLFQLDDTLSAAIQNKDIAGLKDMLKGSDIDGYINAVSSAGDNVDFQKSITTGVRSSLSAGTNILNDAWTASILSDPTLHGVNVISNTIMAALDGVTYAVGAPLHAGASKVAEVIGIKKYLSNSVLRGMLDAPDDTVKEGIKATADYYGEFIGSIRYALGIGKSLLSGNKLVQFGKAPVTGVTEMAGSPYMAALAGKFKPDTLGHQFMTAISNIVGVPGKFLGAEDAIFQIMSLKTHLPVVLREEAIAKGLKGADITAYIKSNLGDTLREIIDNNGHKMLQVVGDEARMKSIKRYMEDMTLQGTPDVITREIMKAKRACPIMHPIIPFVKTPANAIRHFGEHIPGVGMLYAHQREALAKGGLEATRVWGQWGIGAALLSTSVALAQAGVITGSGPKNYQQQKALKTAGYQPNSLHIDGKYLNYSRLDTLGFFLSAGADFAELAQGCETEEEHEYLAEIAHSLLVIGTSALRNRTDLGSIINVYEKLTSDSPADLIANLPKQYIRGAVPSVVPKTMRMVGIMSDAQFEVDTLMDNLRAKLPGFSDDLPEKYNHITGEAYRYAPDGAINPINISEKPDVMSEQVMDAVISYPSAFTPPPNTLNNIGLTAKQRSELARIQGTIVVGGRTFIEAIEAEMAKPKYKAASEEEQAKMLRSLNMKYRKAAQASLIKAFPELKAEDEAGALPEKIRGKGIPPVPTKEALEMTFDNAIGGGNAQTNLSAADMRGLLAISEL